jgi:hypothetical protein
MKTDAHDLEAIPLSESKEPFSAVAGAVVLAYSLAAVGAVSVLCLAAMYALEMDAADNHVFGPLSDIGSVVWNLLLLPLVIGFGRTILPARGGQLLFVLTAASTVVAALGSALLVVGVLPFPVSTAISVAVIQLQAGWLIAVGRGLRPVRGWSRLGRGGELIGIGFWIGALLFAASLLLGWGTPAQWVVMAAGLVPGLLAWFGLPLWVFLVGRRLASAFQSINRRDVS